MLYIRTSRPKIFTTAIVVNLTLTIIAFSLQSIWNVSADVLYRDPNAISGKVFIYGAWSNLVVIGWLVSATIALFVWAMLRQRGEDDKALCFFGLFSAAVGLDDLFMIHDGLLEYFGISAIPLLAAYSFIILLGLLAAWKRQGQYDWMILGTALVAFGASAVLDMIDDAHVLGTRLYVIEDMLKAFGVTLWVAFIIPLAWKQVIVDIEQART